MDKAVRLESVLDGLLRSAPQIEATAMVSADGLPMASRLPASLEEDRVSAMTAAMLSLGERAAGELGRGGLQQIFVEGASGFVILMSAGDAVLCAITSRQAKVGLVLYEMRKAASAAARVLADQVETAVETSTVTRK